MLLADGDEVVVTGGEDGSIDGELPVLPAVIGQVLQPGHDVLIDDGLVRLRVDAVKAGRHAAPSSSAAPWLTQGCERPRRSGAHSGTDTKGH